MRLRDGSQETTRTNIRWSATRVHSSGIPARPKAVHRAHKIPRALLLCKRLRRKRKTLRMKIQLLLNRTLRHAIAYELKKKGTAAVLWLLIAENCTAVQSAVMSTRAARTYFSHRSLLRTLPFLRGRVCAA